MAAKTSKKTSKKTRRATPIPMADSTVRKLAVMPEVASKTGMHIQLDKLLSQNNYKLYRQGMNYHARIELLHDATTSTNSSTYRVYTLPTDHRSMGAIRMAKEIYNAAMKDELEIRPSVKSPWTDFIIEVCDATDSTIWSPLLNVARSAVYRVDTTADKPGQWVEQFSDDYQQSQITDASGNQKTFSLSDATASAYWNIYSEYTNHLLNRPDPESTDDVAAYEGASYVLSEMEELADKGDMPPYSWDWTSKKQDGTEVNRKLQVQLCGIISNGPEAHVSRQPQFLDIVAPLGLIFIESTAAYIDDTVPEIMVTAKPGKYKGVKADRIFKADKLLGF